MIRLADWSPRLDAAIAIGRRAAFEYGQHDCLRFPAACIEAVTGVDLFAPFSGRYQDEAGAQALVPAVEPFLEGLAAQHGWTAVSARQGRRGDLAALRLGPTFLCAVVYGSLFLPEQPRGLRRVNLLMAEKVWRIG